MQLTFGDAEDLGQRKQTWRELFLAQMDRVVPWQPLLKLIAPALPDARPSEPAAVRIDNDAVHLLSAAVVRADRPCMEGALHDTPVMRRFAELGGLDAVPDETTILNFQRLLETHGFAAKILVKVNAHLSRANLSLCAGTIVDATIIAAPSSTKNKDGKRDPQMHQTKKGNQWHFGMKAHIGVDEDSGLLHHVECTAANMADVTQVHALLHGKEDTVSGDSGYAGMEKREEMEAVKARFLIAEKRSKVKAIKDKRERKRADRWEHTKAVRYRGLAKNAAQVMTLFALWNLWMARKRFLPTMGELRL